IVDQLSPAWAPSRTRNSNCVGSSHTGTPHSLSWYSMYCRLLSPAQSQRFCPVMVFCRIMSSRLQGSPEKSSLDRPGELLFTRLGLYVAAAFTFAALAFRVLLSLVPAAAPLGTFILVLAFGILVAAAVAFR